MGQPAAGTRLQIQNALSCPGLCRRRDSEAGANRIIGAGGPIPDVLEDFGSYVGPRLLSFYHMCIKDKDMTTVDVIEVAGSSIHDVIHQHNKNRKPPRLSAHRESPDPLIVHYHSHRKLCPVVRGIIRGLGEKFNEKFEIKETQCMHDGADECVMRIKKLA